MSVADTKAYRRKFKAMMTAGIAPRPKGRSVSESISRNAAQAAAENRRKQAKK